MADAMDALKGILGDGAEDKIKNVMSSLSGGSSDISDVIGNDNSMEYLMQIKDMASRLGNSNSDPRTNLLMSLKPYMRSKRQGSIDSAVKLLNLAKLAVLFK